MYKSGGIFKTTNHCCAHRDISNCIWVWAWAYIHEQSKHVLAIYLPRFFPTCTWSWRECDDIAIPIRVTPPRATGDGIPSHVPSSPTRATPTGTMTSMFILKTNELKLAPAMTSQTGTFYSNSWARRPGLPGAWVPLPRWADPRTRIQIKK